MCKTINEGVREALDREYTVAMVIDSSEFMYPYHPHMEIRYRDRIIGEEVSREKAAELKRKKNNIFLGDTFVIYFDRIPREPGAREEMRLYYLARPFEILRDFTMITDCVLGVPSPGGDAEVKELLDVRLKRPEIGTCLVGYNVSRVY